MKAEASATADGTFPAVFFQSLDLSYCERAFEPSRRLYFLRKLFIAALSGILKKKRSGNPKTSFHRTDPALTPAPSNH